MLPVEVGVGTLEVMVLGVVVSAMDGVGRVNVTMSVGAVIDPEESGPSSTGDARRIWSFWGTIKYAKACAVIVTSFHAPPVVGLYVGDGEYLESTIQVGPNYCPS